MGDELSLLAYGGADGVHGAEEHGYTFGGNGENDWLQFYRPFMRGQVVEAGVYVGATPRVWPL